MKKLSTLLMALLLTACSSMNNCQPSDNSMTCRLSDRADREMEYTAESTVSSIMRSVSYSISGAIDGVLRK